MKTQPYWIDTIKNSCQSCHALGSKGVRTISPEWGHFDNSGPGLDEPPASRPGGDQHGRHSRPAWAEESAGAVRGLDRSHCRRRTAFSKPERPQGVERNVVISMWEWSTPKAYLHDAISTDKRNPRVNANGLIYGSPEESTDMVPVLNPITNETSQIKHPFRDPKTPSSLDYTHGHSIYWGDEPIWDGHTSIHNPMIDEKGRVWFTARIRAAAKSGLLQSGLRSSFGESRAAEHFRSPAIHVRSEDRQVVADRHLLQHAASVFREGRQQHTVDQRRRPG